MSLTMTHNMEDTFRAAAQSVAGFRSPFVRELRLSLEESFLRLHVLWQAVWSNLRVGRSSDRYCELRIACHPICFAATGGSSQHSEDTTMTTKPTSTPVPTFSEFQSAFKTLEKEGKLQIVYLMELLSHRPELADEVLARADGGLQ